MKSTTGSFASGQVSRWLHPAVLLVLFAVLGLLAYAPVLDGQWIWDDLYLVNDNPFFKSPVFVWEVFRRHLFLESFGAYYRPVQNWFYMADYALWGQGRVGYHVTSVLVHATAAVLIQRLFARLLTPLLEEKQRAQWIAAVAALLWLVHPMHNAAVAYVSGRADSLAAMFAAGAWLLFLQSRELTGGRRALRWLGAAACALLAFCSKEIGLIWAALFALHTLFFDRKTVWKNRAATLAALAGLVGVYVWLRHLPEPITGGPGDPPMPFGQRVVLMLRALGDYARVIFWPAKLMMERTIGGPGLMSRPVTVEMLREFYLLAWAGGGVIAALVALAVVPGPTVRARRWGVTWFVVGFLPISNLIELNADCAEHWIYHSSIGLLVALCAAASGSFTRWRKIAAPALAVVVVALGVRTALRAEVWSEPEKFYLRTIADGGTTPRVTMALAGFYGLRGDTAREEDTLRRMVKWFPHYYPAHVQLANCLLRQGREAEAKPIFEAQAAVGSEVTRAYAKAYTNTMNLADLKAKDSPEEALRLYREARASNPHSWPLAHMETQMTERIHGPAAALRVVADFSTAHWWHLESKLALAHFQMLNARPREALETLEAAAELDIRNPKPFLAQAEIFTALNRPEAAAEAAQRASARSGKK